ncbi:hypothetical protein D3C73_774170 [compost metagenome]
MGEGDGLLQGLFQGRRLHVRLDVAEQVRRAGLHPVGFRVQCSRADPYRLVILVVALGIQAQLILRDLEEGLVQTEFGQQGLFHRLIER